VAIHLFFNELKSSPDGHALRWNTVKKLFYIITRNIADFKMGELKFPRLIIMTPQQYCDLYL